jgi:HK97 family phage major capsid protein
MPESITKAMEALSTLRKDFDVLGAKLMVTIQNQDAAILKNGKGSEEIGKLLDAHNAKWLEIQNDVKGLSTQMVDALAGVERMKFATAARHISLGQVFVSSDQFKAMKTDGQYHSAKMEVKGGFVRPSHRKETAITDASAGALVQEFRYDQVIQDPLRPRRIADLIPSINVSQSSVEYPRENLTFELYAELFSQAASGQADLIIGTLEGRSKARGFIDGATISIAFGTGAVETKIIDSINHSTGTITLTTNLANTHAAGISITADSFEFTPEAQIKPLSRIEYELIVETVKTLATIIPFSKQMMDDAPALQGLLDSRMHEFLELSLENQLLNGDGTTNQFEGILNNPDIQTYLQSSGTVGDTKLDAVRRSFTQVFLAFYPVDGVVFHPSDWEDIELSKGSDGHYMFMQAQLSPGVSQIWRATAVQSSAITSGTWLAGAFRLGAIIWDRQQANVSVSDQNRNWWERNILGLRAEERKAFSVVRPTSFVAGTFDGAPA